MPQNDMRDMGRDLALSDPFMQIGQTIAKVGEMVQAGDVPQSVVDAYDYVKSHLSSSSKKVQDALETLTNHVSQTVSAQAQTPLLSNRQGPEQPPASSQPTEVSLRMTSAPPKSRTLSEDEFNGIRQKVLTDAPNGLDEAGFNRYIAYALPQAIGTAENMPAQPEGGAVERFGSNLVAGLNPIPFVKKALTQSPIATIGDLVGPQLEQYKKAKEAQAQGRTFEMVGHSVAAAIPLLGPMAANAGEQIASGDVAGGLGSATAAVAPFAADAALAARAKTGAFDNPIARAKSADLVRRSAEEQVAQKVLAPGNPRYKGIAQALAPDVLKRGLSGGRLELQQVAEAGMHDAGTALDTAIEQAGGTSAPVSPATIVDRLQRRVASLSVDGKPIAGAEGRVAALQTRIKQLAEMSRPKQSGILNARGAQEVYGDPSSAFSDLKKFRDEQYRQAAEGKGYERAGNQTMADEAWAAREAGSAVRQAFAERSPASAAANAEYTFWKSLDDVLDPTQGRPKVSTPPSGVTGGARTAGAAAGALIGPKAAFVLSVVKPWLEKVTAEPSWQLADAGRKMQLAKAIETGNQGLARSLMLSIGKYSPKDQADSQQKALQVGPYRVEPQ
jgi:hypothetical protein